MKRTSLITLAAIMLATITATAQNPSGPPKPGPEVEKLKIFLGNWKTTGDIKASPMGPAGSFTGTSKNAWMPGGFFIEVHGAGDLGAMGKFTNMAYLGHDPENKVYTYDEFASTGEHTMAKGTVEGDTWTWTTDYKMGGKEMKGRYTEKITSPTSYDFKYEASMDGSPFVTVMEGKATKAATAAAGAKPAAGKAAPGKTETASDAGKPKAK